MKHCLVVDDSRVIRTVARRIFEDMQFSVGEAEDGMAALRACRDHMPDVILVDAHLPGMKGVDFLRSVRGQPNGDRPVIVISITENDADEIAQAVGAGANEYLMKPFDPASVRAKLTEIGRALVRA